MNASVAVIWDPLVAEVRVQWSRVRGRCRHLCPWALFAAGTHRASLVCWALRRANIAHCPRSWPTCSLDLRPRSPSVTPVHFYKLFQEPRDRRLFWSGWHASLWLSRFERVGRTCVVRNFTSSSPALCPILLSVPFDLDFIREEQNERTIYKE